ncbi:MAG: FtsX-like permease family protein, partial [bacterium]|nr:FtsX-like permease family protein [bacterium]
MKKSSPPQLAEYLLKFLAPDNLSKTAPGDFEEIYNRIYSNKGRVAAGIWYWWQVLKSIPVFIKDKFYRNGTMFKNYLKTTIRYIIKQKGYSFLNISGLALGMACCVLILIWVENELSFDSFHENVEDIYRVTNDWGRVTPPPLAPTLKSDYPEVINSARFYSMSGRLVKYENKVFYEDRIAFADPSFFKIMDFPFIKGVSETSFINKNSIVLTESMAEKYFGKIDPVGKVLNIDNKYDLVVTGVLANLPDNTYLKADFFTPFELLWNYHSHVSQDNWGYNSYETYILLKENTDLDAFQGKLTALNREHFPNSSGSYPIQNIRDIRLYNIKGERTGITNIYIFSALAVLVLVTACINFMNLSTARSVKRAREIGMRKTVGARKRQLITQFFSESFSISFIAFIFALILVRSLLPVFSGLSGNEMSFDVLNGSYIIGLLGVVIFTGLLSGSYPALLLSSFQPVSVLKGSVRSGASHFIVRRVLVIAQFSLSTFLIICTIVIFNQLSYIKNKDLGYDSDNIIYFRMKGNLNKSFQAFKNEVLQNPVFSSITASGSRTGADTHFGTRGWTFEGKEPEDDVLTGVRVDYDYIKTMGMEIIEGQDFKTISYENAVNSVILNETAVKTAGVDFPVGKTFSFWRRSYNIAGVVKDYHYDSIHESIIPVVIIFDPEECVTVVVKLVSGGEEDKAIAFLRQKWEKFVPDFPFEYSFLDEAVKDMYGTEEKTGTMLGYFTILALI